MADVPNVSGVPSVAFASNLADAGIALATADSTLAASLFGDQQWGVYQGGSPVITADSTISMEYRQEWSISDYPVEKGAFESYDKVQTPFSARVRFSAGGSEDNRSTLLSSIAAIAGDLNFYDVVTPEQIYQSVNVVHYDYRRSAQNGNGLLVVDVWLLEVRVTVQSSTSSSTATASGADATNGGSVQGQSPTTTQSVQSGTGSETAASAQTDAGTGYTSVPLPPERPATLQPSTGGGIGHA